MMEILATLNPFALGLAFFMAAALYASVGHGGASAYLAVMGLFGITQVEMKPIALALNIAVSLVALGRIRACRTFPGTLVLAVGRHISSRGISRRVAAISGTRFQTSARRCSDLRGMSASAWAAENR